MSQDKNELHVLYFQVTDIWKRFCENHTELLDKTFEEYALLLSSDIDQLEEVLIQKQEIIKKINFLEAARERVITKLNIYLRDNNQKEVDSVSELIEVMQYFEDQNNTKHLYRFNMLLIDIIEKIQDQNKKNQVFLNKAINNLREIREEAMGVKSYSTYNQKGFSVKPLR
ncbi:MAG: flagellar protein FlgN [Bacteriovoracaceae bacterium]|nr:flagellar protein FlgN [Bacteriovoracaceae bacterium]